MSDVSETLMAFPSEYVLKAIGQDAGQAGSFLNLVVDLIHHHVPENDRQGVSQRLSSNGKYTAVTVTFTVRSLGQLETIYAALNGHPAIRMLL